jgi:hypothetical protein
MPNQYTNGPTIQERLSAHSYRDGDCLISTYAPDSGGYSQVRYGGKNRKVHSVSYEVFVGPIPAGLTVQHSCNRRNCWEPSHLSVGTPKQNSEYMVASGRSPAGERCGHAKLTNEKVREIRLRRERGATLAQLGTEYGVHLSVIGRIVRRKTWKHVA